MKIGTLLWPGPLAAFLWIGCPGAWAASLSWTSPTDAVDYGKSQVSLIQAIAVAQRRAGGRAIHADFQVQRGKGIFKVETLANRRLATVTIDAGIDQVIDFTASGAIDTMSGDQRKAIEATATAKHNLENAAAQGDEMGDWTVDAGVEVVAGKAFYRVDVLKDGKLKTVAFDPNSGQVLPTAAAASLY